MAADSSSSSRPDIKTWSRALAEDRLYYTVSTDRDLVQLDALNAAFGSDLLWWARPLADDEMLKRMLDNSLCFGLYVQQQQDVDGVPLMTEPKMIGFARVITDYVTFGYLTDVYVLPDHQGKGLGRWMMACLNEHLDSSGWWPELRRLMLLTSDDPAAARLYGSTLGARDIRGKLVVMEKLGPGVRSRQQNA